MEQQASHKKRALIPLLIYLLHLGLVVYATPYDVAFGGDPFMGIDYQTHFEQTRTVSTAIQRWGKTWAYDPFLLAGQPAGLIFDVDNKAHCLFTHALTRLGANQAVAFNLFVLLEHLLAPLLIWFAARLLGMGFKARTISLALSALIWHFDSAAHWYWWAGMNSFALASHLSMVVIALLYRLINHYKTRYLLALLVLLPLTLMTHVWAFSILAVPLTGLYIHAWRRLRPSGHLRIWAIALTALAVNMFWLWPALNYLHYIAPSGRGGQATPLSILTDYLDIFISGLVAGTIGTRTFFRFAAYCGAAIYMVRLFRARDPRFFVASLSLGWFLTMAYVFALLPYIEETEPYRFILPSMLMAAILAGPWWAEVFSRQWIRALSPTAKAVLVVLLVLLAPRPLNHIIYFIPHLMPREEGPSVPRPNIAGPRALEPVSKFVSFRHDPIPADYRQVRDYLEKHCKEPGRVLVEWWVLGEYLRWSTSKQLIGGFPDRRIIHEASNIFRYINEPRHYGKKLADYLVRYNIRYLVVSVPYQAIETRRDLLQPLKLVGSHRIYRVRHLGNYLLKGRGKVKAALNRLEVRDAAPAKGTQFLVLRYHYLNTLRCSPGCRLLRWRLPDNPVGFIKVEGTPSLPQHFVIENKY